MKSEDIFLFFDIMYNINHKYFHSDILSYDILCSLYVIALTIHLSY